MHQTLEDLCNALDKLALAVTNAWTDDRTLCEVHGWHHPAVTRHDLASLPAKLSAQIRKVSPDQIDDSLDELLEDVPRRLKVLQGSTLPYMFNGNGHQAVPAYVSTIEWLQQAVQPLLDWQSVDNKTMPAALARRLRSINADLSEIVPEKEALSAQVKLIQDATATAESLPTDLENLREARKKVEKYSTDAAELFGNIQGQLKKVTEATDKTVGHEQEAKLLVQQCEEAYRITTTKGLAAAFDQRTDRLARSMWVWVIGLISTLGIGAYLGSHRIELLSSALTAPDPQWGVIWMHIVLSLLSVGAPLWFAWLATKQIGQRFRLSEDYGFKASVAKAYEGYRREAARIDEAFEARLFSSALTRLEEAPLRLVEQESHGSPWHELISSEAFQKAMNAFPDLKEKFVNVAHGMSEKIAVAATTPIDEKKVASSGAE